MTGFKASRLLGLALCIGGTLVALSAATLGATPAVAGVGVVALAVTALYAIRRPTVVLVALVVVEVTNLSGVTHLPLISALVGLGLLTVGLSLRDRAMLQRLNRWTALAAVLVAAYLGTQALAVLGSQNMEASTTRLIEMVLDCVFLLLVLVLIQLTRRPWVVAQSFVLSLAALALLSVVNELVFDGLQSFFGFSTVTQATADLITTPRYAGPLQDSNFWGRQLILGLPLAGALVIRALRRQRRTAAWGWAAAAVGLLGGIYLTQSRGTMIATAVVLIVWAVASGPAGRRVGLRLLPLTAVFLALPGVGDRLLILITDIFTPGPKLGVDLSVLERAASLEMAWAMFLDRPLFGIGPNVFESMVWLYAGRAETAVPRPTNAPHNVYAQLAAESGVVGLVGWAIFLGSVICLLILHMRRTSWSTTTSDRVLSAAVLAAIVGWSFASIFLHLAYFRTLGIIVALGLALSFTRVDEAVRTAPMRTGMLRQVTLSVALGTASACALLALSGTQTHVASTTVTLLPTEQVTGQFAYALDARSRDVIIPTYAAVMAANSPGTTAVPDAVRGVITMTEREADAESARAALTVAWANAHRNLELSHLDHTYTISQVGPIREDSRVRHSPVSIAAALLVGLVTAMWTMLLMRRASARWPRHGSMTELTGMSGVQRELPASQRKAQ